MTVQEQQEIKLGAYKEAMRYIANAKDYLQKAGMDGKWYKDKKYVRSACGTAYSGILEALDAWLLLKGIEPPKGKRKSILFYEQNVGRLDKKVSRALESAYSALHLSGYYDGILDSAIIKSGFENAKELIDLIKPMQGEL